VPMISPKRLYTRTERTHGPLSMLVCLKGVLQLLNAK
jgi:hypothetical protein